MNRTLRATTLAAVVSLAAAASARAQLAISIKGECPGRMSVRWEGAAADEWAGLVFGLRKGHMVVPGPWCSGVELGLSGAVQIVHLFPTGPEGRGEINGRGRARACGGYLQMVVQDGHPCTTSNAVQIPQ